MVNATHESDPPRESLLTDDPCLLFQRSGPAFLNQASSRVLSCWLNRARVDFIAGQSDLLIFYHEDEQLGCVTSLVLRIIDPPDLDRKSNKHIKLRACRGLERAETAMRIFEIV